MKSPDVPFDECCKRAKKFADDGAVVFQRWTCDGCGERVTANKPNYFTELGHHEECGHVTNIKAKGCGYTIMLAL